jgi:ribose transport system permease protein
MGDKKSRRIFLKRHRDTLLAFVILLVVLVLFASNQNDFFTKYGPQSIFNQVITLAIVALSQTMVILTAGIDLSVGAVVGYSVAATVMDPLSKSLGSVGLGITVTAGIVLILGGIAGWINGVFIVYGRLQPIIVTLATSSIYTGIALYIRPTPGGKVASSYTEFFTGRVLDYIPMSAIVLAIFIFLVWVPLRRSRLGQSIYAIGGNEYSAFISGINVNRTKLWVYTLSGLFSAFAGLLLTAQTASGDPLGSSLFTLNSIAAVVLGGAPLYGGKGSYIGSAAGAGILSLILGLLIFWGVPSFYQNAVQGAVLIVALSLGVVQRLIRQKWRHAN